MVIKIEAIADIISIYEIVLLSGFSEQYKIVYNQNIKLLNHEQSNPQNNQDLIYHYLSKSNIISKVEERLRFLNQKILLKKSNRKFLEKKNIKFNYHNTANIIS